MVTRAFEDSVEAALERMEPVQEAGLKTARAVHDAVLSDERARGVADALHGTWLGHPLHPALTDVTIGMLVLASGLSVIGALGWIEEAAGKAAWLALIGGLIAAAPTAVTGFADWLTLEWGSPTWRTATLHLGAMVTAVCLYGVAAWLQWDGYQDGTVTTGGLVLALLGFVAVTAGGWLGGTIVFVHGMRVEAARDSVPDDELPRRESGAA